MRKYDDIINLPHYKNPNRKQMSNHDRAAQFAPFSALTGYDEAVRQQEVQFDEVLELSEDEMNLINEALNKLQKYDEVEVVYYDEGFYRSIEGIVMRIDTYERYFTIDNKKIYFDDLIEISFKENKNGL